MIYIFVGNLLFIFAASIYYFAQTPGYKYLSYGFFMFFIYFLFIQSDSSFSFSMIMLIPLVLTLAILSLGVSLILSSLFIVAKDISQVWTIIMGIGFWVSPIVFKLEQFRSKLPGLDYVNPVSGIIINSRRAILDGQFPEWNLFFWNIGYSIFFLLIGIYMLNKLGSKAAEKL